MSATEYVILVNEQNKAIGIEEKLSAHQKNLLHRAFSIFIFCHTDRGSELLLQRRALHKYHSAGLWSNTCCSHPRTDETIVAAGQRRLQEELGFTTPLEDKGWFQYNAHFGNGLSEHEIDHVLVGNVPQGIVITPNQKEVHEYRWVLLSDLKTELVTHPQKFTPWLPEALEKAAGCCNLL